MFDVYVTHQARLRPAAPAILTPNEVVSFGKLDADVTRTAALLCALEVDANRPVTVDVHDHYLAWLVTLALARLGAPSAPGADGACPLRVAERADDRPAFVIGEREIAAMLSGPVYELPRPDLPASGIGRIMLSSGTTGADKRIALSWGMIEASIRNVPVTYGAPPGPWLMATGIHTILGFVMTLGCWALGTPVLMGVPEPLDGAKLVTLRPGLIAMTPGQLGGLVTALPDDHPRHPLRAVTGGGPVPHKLLARTREVLTHDLVSVYGASECGAIAVASAGLLDRSPTAAGFVLPGVTVQIVDDHGAVVGTGELGHVRVASDRVASGYLRGDANAFRDGWFWPGDLGRLDAQGLLCLEGRADDLMNLRGQKILPGWVEAAAQTAPGVREVAAFSLIDANGWERCWIAVVAGEEFSERELAQALSDALIAAEEIGWLRMDRLPRNAMGKIERNRLRDQARAFEDARR